jgi:hypothetical protein
MELPIHAMHGCATSCAYFGHLTPTFRIEAPKSLVTYEEFIMNTLVARDNSRSLSLEKS